MTSPETIRKIRLDNNKGISQRQIAKKRGVDRKTVSAILKSDIVESFYPERANQEYPKLGDFQKALEEMMIAEQDTPHRKRSKFTRYFERLTAIGYVGGYDSVRRYCRSWLKEKAHTSPSPTGCVPMVFAPGEAFQFDWTPEYAIINGVSTPVHLAVMTLCHSRMSFARAYPRETTEMVLDAHVKAFSFFGGSCRRGIYDNMKTAVIKVHKGKERDWQKNFDLMSSHYLFEHNACTPAEPQEKGIVERNIQTIQEDFFRPYPRSSTLDELNENLEAECIHRARTRHHPEFKNKYRWNVFLEEKKALTMIHREFDAHVVGHCRVGQTQLSQYDRNKYSVPSQAINKVVDIRVYADKLTFVHKGIVIAQHRRVFGRDKVVTQFEHYLNALHRKPGAIRNGVLFQDDLLPAAIVELRWRMKEKFDDADRQLVDILCAVRDYGVEDVNCACELALEAGPVSKDIVLNILYRINEEKAAESIPEPEHLKLSDPPSDDCSIYNNLIKGNIHEQKRRSL